MKIFNRRVQHNFQLLDRLEGGMVLTGGEVKSLKEGKASLEGAFVKIKDGEAYLINAFIHGANPTKTRKILLHKKEILLLENKMRQKKLTIVPVVCYSRGARVKLELALAKGKREYEKKESAKKRDLQREAEQELANFRG